MMYLAAIIAANLLVAWFGPNLSVVNAFLFIGLDLTARDRLHDAWRGCGLWWKMALLIAAGSILSFIMNRSTGRIALASFAAFAVSGGADALIYHLLGAKASLVRVNGSNIAGAAIDSIVFPLLAFGWPPLVLVMLGQFAAKVGGGFAWSLILSR